jgi:hypothetical protein
MVAGDLAAIRALIPSVLERIDAVEESATERFDQYETTMAVRDRSNRRWKTLFAVVAVVVVAALVFVGIGMRENTESIDRANAIREREAAAACERGNNAIAVDRFIIEGQFEDYNLVAANQTPERQQFLANRRQQRLNRLEELRPVRDCG